IDPTSDLGFHGLNQKPLGTFPENPAQHILTFTEWKDSCLNVTIVHGGVLLCLVGTRVSSYLHPEYAAFFIQPSTTFGYIPEMAHWHQSAASAQRLPASEEVARESGMTMG